MECAAPFLSPCARRNYEKWLGKWENDDSNYEDINCPACEGGFNGEDPISYTKLKLLFLNYTSIVDKYNKNRLCF